MVWREAVGPLEPPPRDKPILPGQTRTLVVQAPILAGSPPATVGIIAQDTAGQTTRAEVQALGVGVLAPVALAKRPTVYGDRLLAAPVAGRRAACAALAAAVAAQPRVQGTVVVAFTVQSLYGANAGLSTVRALQGPFAEIKQASLTARYPDTAVETVALAQADSLAHALVTWMEGR